MLYSTIPEIITNTKQRAEKITVQALEHEVRGFCEPRKRGSARRKAKAYTKRVSFWLKRRVDPQEVVQRVLKEMDTRKRRKAHESRSARLIVVEAFEEEEGVGEEEIRRPVKKRRR